MKALQRMTKASLASRIVRANFASTENEASPELRNLLELPEYKLFDAKKTEGDKFGSLYHLIKLKQSFEEASRSSGSEYIRVLKEQPK